MNEPSQEDTNLLNSLQNLELEKATKEKHMVNLNEFSVNPFKRRRRSKSLSSINFGSSCDDCIKKQQAVKHTTSFKRTNKKILREPILKLVKCSHKMNDAKILPHKVLNRHKKKDRLFGHGIPGQERDFKSIIDACEQLNLDAGNVTCDYSSPSFLTARFRSNSNPVRNENTNSNMGSCSHQARMNTTTPCDVTIDELASYFETFVHIPKKMSTMAEMMYI